MPELPEVETTRRGIAPHISEQRIERVQVRDHRLRWPIARDLAATITGLTISSVSRRAKYLLIDCGKGQLMIHLGMSGSLRVCMPGEALLKHDHLIIEFQDCTLRFNDPRRFGCVLWLDQPPEQHKLLNNLGPEPLTDQFSGEYLFKLSRKRKCCVKTFIMDNKIVVGVGNIYANEALFTSKIRPRRRASRVSRAQYELLAYNIKDVLGRAIEKGGTTLRDFVGGDGKPGYFQQTLKVYNRKDQPCVICSSLIKQIVVGQRGTFYCPQCQQ